jgi:phytoene dehydrogenase-like protein
MMFWYNKAYYDCQNYHLQDCSNCNRTVCCDNESPDAWYMKHLRDVEFAARKMAKDEPGARWKLQEALDKLDKAMDKLGEEIISHDYPPGMDTRPPRWDLDG